MNILPFNGVFPQIASSCYISKGVYIIGDVKIGEHSSVWFGTVIRGDVNFIRIGDYVSVQDGSILHVTTEKYPLTIGNRVVIGHRVVLHGCKIGSNVLIGMGSVIMDGVTVGDNCVIAAGTLITQNKVIPDNSLVMGNPGKVVKRVSEDMLKKVDEGIENYRRLVSLYKKSETS